MMDKVASIVKKVKSEVGTLHYKIEILMALDPPTEEDNQFATSASIDVLPKYLTARIILYPYLKELYNRHGQQKLVEIICHEISHIYVDQVASLAERRYVMEEDVQTATEQVTELFGRMLTKVISKDA